MFRNDFRNTSSDNRKVYIGIGVVVLVIIGVLLTRASYPGKVIGFLWERTYKIEKFQTENDSGWSLPPDAFNVYRTSRIHHYDDIYEHRTVKENGRTVTKRIKVGESPVYRTYYEYSINRWSYFRSLTTRGRDKGNMYWPEFTRTPSDSRGLGATRIGRAIENLSVCVEWTKKSERKVDYFTVNSYSNVLVGDIVAVHYILGVPTSITFAPKAEAVD